MEAISIEKSLDFYLTTLSYLDNRHLDDSDDDLKYYILEELDADAHTFLHSWTVDRLIVGGLIPSTVVADTQTLRDMVKKLIETKPTVKEIRFDTDWKKARELASNILAKIETYLGQLSTDKDFNTN